GSVYSRDVGPRGRSKSRPLDHRGGQGMTIQHCRTADEKQIPRFARDDKKYRRGRPRIHELGLEGPSPFDTPSEPATLDIADVCVVDCRGTSNRYGKIAPIPAFYDCRPTPACAGK